MTSAQKIIKYIAVAFAIFLVITIISSILGAFYVMSGIFGLKNDIKIQTTEEMIITNLDTNDLETLEINVAFSNLTMKIGKYFKVETNSDDIKCEQNGKSLEIKEKKYKWFSSNNSNEILIYIPEDFEFEKIKINSGAGKINIENLNTKKLDFELGAGETEIDNLNISKSCNIDGGAGKLDILSGKINNLDLDMGVGKINLCSTLIGKSEIDAGIGNLNINLQGNKDDYKIKSDKGIGSIKIDRREILDGEVYGNGDNSIEVNGGIGSIEITLENNML